MRKPFENTKLEIVVISDVELGGKTFQPSDNLVAQATDSSRSSWHIGHALGNSICTVGWDELEQSKDRGLISYDCPA